MVDGLFFSGCPLGYSLEAQDVSTRSAKVQEKLHAYLQYLLNTLKCETSVDLSEQMIWIALLAEW